MGGEFTYQPKWDPKTVLTTTRLLSVGAYAEARHDGGRAALGQRDGCQQAGQGRGGRCTRFYFWFFVFSGLAAASRLLQLSFLDLSGWFSGGFAI